MSRALIIRPEAEADIEEAQAWYEQQREGLGDRFLQTVEDCLRVIREHPLAFQIVHKRVRRNLLSRFPYAILYTVKQGTIFVIACMHTKRSPRRWQQRI